jgi:hypothetical protein
LYLKSEVLFELWGKINHLNCILHS